MEYRHANDVRLHLGAGRFNLPGKCPTPSIHRSGSVNMKKHALLLVGIILLALLFPVGSATSDEFREEQVKVAFLYNFAKFVDWPAESFKNDSAPIIIVLLGVDPFGSLLDSLKEKNVKGRRFQIRRVSKPENLDEGHILFISVSEKANLRSLLAMAKNHNLLTISDMDHFAGQGGMIGLINVEGKINFEINLDIVQKSRIKFSAQLLKLAKIVHSGP